MLALKIDEIVIMEKTTFLLFVLCAPGPQKKANITQIHTIEQRVAQ